VFTAAMTQPQPIPPDDPAPPGDDPAADAAAAGLRYVAEDEPGLGRHARGRGFAYRDAGGAPVRDRETLSRIRSLAVPPAWTEVWICADPLGHLQATGRDEAGRKQYRYHPEFRRARDLRKYARLADFARAVPAIRRRVDLDLRRPGLPKEKVLAAAVRLMDAALLRVGGREYAKDHSFGLTTLRDRHARIEGDDIRLEFRGKSGRRWTVRLHDRRLAKVVRSCRDVPGQDLFQYVDDDGTRHAIGSGDVNDYIRRAAGADFTAKDFRTLAGTRLCARALAATPPPGTRAVARRGLAGAVRETARALGNTPAVCRSGYVHPAVPEAWEAGRLDPESVATASDAELIEHLVAGARPTTTS
jgi:DNA topoisomerase-1